MWTGAAVLTNAIFTQKIEDEILFAMFVKHGLKRFITLKVFWSHRISILIKPMGGCSSAVSPEDPNAQQNAKTNWCVCCGSRQDSTAALLSKKEQDLDCARPTIEEAKKWPTSFETVLKHKFGLQLFQDFLRSQYGEENLSFWLAVEDYKKSDESTQAEKARLIYEDYVSTLSPTEISLDAKVRAEIDKSMSNPDKDTFKCAQDHIFTLMYHDCFPRFIKSKHYKQLLKKHWPRLVRSVDFWTKTATN